MWWLLKQFLKIDTWMNRNIKKRYWHLFRKHVKQELQQAGAIKLNDEQQVIMKSKENYLIDTEYGSVIIGLGKYNKKHYEVFLWFAEPMKARGKYGFLGIGENTRTYEYAEHGKTNKRQFTYINNISHIKSSDINYVYSYVVILARDSIHPKDHSKIV